MTGFDWVIVAIAIVSVIVAMFRGLIKETLSLATWILSFWLAIVFSTDAGDFIHQYISIPAPLFRTWAGFAAIFISSLFALTALSYFLHKLIVKGPTKGIDKFLGIGFGFVRGAAIVVAILIVLRAFGFANSGWWQASTLIPRFVPAMNFVEALLPDSMQREAQKQQSAEQRIQDRVLERLRPEPDVDSKPSS